MLNRMLVNDFQLHPVFMDRDLKRKMTQKACCAEGNAVINLGGPEKKLVTMMQTEHWTHAI